MKVKKIYFFVLSIAITTHSVQCLDDDMFIDELDNPTHIQMHVEQEHLSFSDGQDCCFPIPDTPSISSSDLLDFLTILVDGGIAQTLTKNLFLGTNPLQSRSLLDLPSTGLDLTINHDHCGQLMFNFFYNQTSRMKYRCNSKCIGSYINITSKDIIEDIDEDILPGFTSDDVLDLFLRANPFSLQERRAGMMINYNRRWGRGVFGVNLPLYYFERNFFLTDAQQEVIAAAPIFQQFGPISSDADEVLDYGYKNLVSDQLGFGDTRLNGYFTFVDSPKHYGTIGAVLTVPTAFALFKHLLGGKYCKTKKRPIFDLVEVANLYYSDLPNKEELLQNLFYSYSTCILHQLTANVAYTSLGNYHHVTIGPRFEYDYKIKPNWALKLYSDVQYFCPAKEKRFYIPIRDPNALSDAVRQYSEESRAEENLRFLSEQITEVVFPKCITTTVHPGFLINLSAATWFKTKRTKIELGYNFWRQSREKIKLACKQDMPYYVNKGVKPDAYENKLYARCFIKMPERCGGMHFGFYGDYTFQSYNIGRDFTLAANIELYY